MASENFLSSISDVSEGEENCDSALFKPECDEKLNAAERDPKFRHFFVEAKLMKPAGHNEVRRLLAQYRRQSSELFRRRLLEMEGTNKEPKKKRQVIGHPAPQTDVLDPFLHQRIAVLFSSFSEKSVNSPGFCINPWVVCMEFYGRNDISLGDFLERYCFSKDYRCPSAVCEAKMTQHTRKIVHGFACVEITVQQIIDSPPGKEQTIGKIHEQILCWDWCGKCKQTSASTPMSGSMWHLSFARYLDYLFNAITLGAQLGDRECADCIFHLHDHYFAYGNSVAQMKISPILLSDTVEISKFTILKAKFQLFFN